MHILVLGRSGQVAHEIINLLANTEHALTVLARPEVDFADPLSVSGALKCLDATKIDIVINAAAYTEVDKAEQERDIADAVNHLSVANIAKWCAENVIWLIHYSTDYVFDGKARAHPFVESDAVAPINFYGETKLRGEQAITQSGCPHLILRTSWVYADRGNNFLLTMLRLSESRDELDVVNDQHGVPNAATELAGATIHTLPRLKNNLDSLSGIYHLTAQPPTTWFGFAKEIFKQAGTTTTVNAVKSEAFPTPARRPQYSVMDNRKFCSTFHYQFDNWQDALARTLSTLKQSSNNA